MRTIVDCSSHLLASSLSYRTVFWFLGFNGPWIAWNVLDAPALAFFPTAPSLAFLAASTGLFLVGGGSIFTLETVF